MNKTFLAARNQNERILASMRRNSKEIDKAARQAKAEKRAYNKLVKRLIHSLSI